MKYTNVIQYPPREAGNETHTSPEQKYSKWCNKRLLETNRCRKIKVVMTIVTNVTSPQFMRDRSFRKNYDCNSENEVGSLKEDFSLSRDSIKMQTHHSYYPKTSAADNWAMTSKWISDENRNGIWCYLESEPRRMSHRKRMLSFWVEKGIFKVTELTSTSSK